MIEVQKKAFSVFAVAFLLCGVFGGLVTQQVLGHTVELWDDTAGFWVNGAGCTLTTVTATAYVYSGSSSVQVNTSGASWFYHDYGAANLQDWSAYGYMNFYWYGNNSGDTITCSFYDTDQSGYFRISMFDNFVGWKIYTRPFSEMQLVGDASNATLGGIRYIMFESLITAQSYYVDKFWLSNAEVEVTSIASADWGGFVFFLAYLLVEFFFLFTKRGWIYLLFVGLFGLGVTGYFAGYGALPVAPYATVFLAFFSVFCLVKAGSVKRAL